MRKLVLICAVASFFTAGCSSRPEVGRGEAVGTVGGAVAGGAVGSAVTGGSTLGTIGGAVVGGAVGNEVGDRYDKREGRR